MNPTLVVSLRSVVPTAIGRIPPSFLLRAHRFAPKKMGWISTGISFLRMKLTSLVNDSKSLFHASDAPIRCFRCPGFSPSGPPADPAGNEKMADFTDSEDTGMWTSSLSGAGGK